MNKNTKGEFNSSTNIQSSGKSWAEQIEQKEETFFSNGNSNIPYGYEERERSYGERGEKFGSTAREEEIQRGTSPQTDSNTKVNSAYQSDRSQRNGYKDDARENSGWYNPGDSKKSEGNKSSSKNR